MRQRAGSARVAAAAVGGRSRRRAGRRLDGPQADAAVLRAARQQQLVPCSKMLLMRRPIVGYWALYAAFQGLHTGRPHARTIMCMLTVLTPKMKSQLQTMPVHRRASQTKPKTPEI